MVKYEDERAFPVTMEDGRGESMTNLGMTMRDYFAAKAMQAALQNISSCSLEDAERIALTTPGLAYVIADAMLLERAK